MTTKRRGVLSENGLEWVRLGLKNPSHIQAREIERTVLLAAARRMKSTGRQVTAELLRAWAKELRDDR